MTQTHTKTLCFSAIDSLFFKESRPMDAMGISSSIFPPTMQTVTGLVRSWVGRQENVNWQAFISNENHPLCEIIGSNKADDLGSLHFKGVWISKNGQRLYSVPRHIMQKEQTLYALRLAKEGIKCDLGNKVRLPELPCETAMGSLPLDNTWVNAETLQLLLRGELPTDLDTGETQNFFTLTDLLVKEPRVGIARNNQQRTVKQGMLYQTEHLRLQEDVCLEVEVAGLPESCKTGDSLVRFGGESRMAQLQVCDQNKKLPVEAIPTTNPDIPNKGILIYLLTPLLIPQSEKYQPLPDFVQVSEENATYWQGKVNDITLTLHGAVTGKLIREGGWDLAKGKPREDRSFIPAGSVFFCTTENDIQMAINNLHGIQLGNLKRYGYGQIATSLWNQE